MTSRPTRERERGRTRRAGLLVAAGTVAVAFAVLVAVSVTRAEPSGFDASLPNPMGGPARVAPGDASGEVELAGLQIAGSKVTMGDLALGVTYVPAWEVANPTDREVSFSIGQPQVLDGCCPGPIYVDGELTRAEQAFPVAPGASRLVQFPLQMHRGMDGFHHLELPLLADGEQAAVHVTGNFDPSVAPN